MTAFRLRPLLFAGFLLTAAACSGPNRYLSSDSEPWLQYERSPCFGPCPAFTLTVEANGHARFSGRRNASPEGKHEAQWSQQDLQILAVTAHAVQLHRHEGRYDNPLISDLPSVTLQFGGVTVFDRVDGPPIDALYKSLDSLIAATAWTPSGH